MIRPLGLGLLALLGAFLGGAGGAALLAPRDGLFEPMPVHGSRP